jgi:hypothetical protein
VDILNGRAAASLVFCNLDKQRGYRMTEEARVSYYAPFVSDPASPPPSTRSVSVGSLHREGRSLLGTVVLIGEASDPPADRYDVRFSMDSDKAARFACSSEGAQRDVIIDLSSRTIDVA